MDEQTGRMLNADMEFYKLAGIADIGDIMVHMDIRSGARQARNHRPRRAAGHRRSVAAIANAVANAIGVRVPNVPLTPDRAAGMPGREERLMQAFEYANPTTRAGSDCAARAEVGPTRRCSPAAPTSSA